MTESIKIPIIKRMLPSISFQDIDGVQPMTEYTGQVFSFKYITGPIHYEQGTLIHDFVCGYMRYYGTDFIPEDLWWKIKIKGL